MDAPLISVIVPVYRVEAYLERCVQSIVDQTYQNLEIILVDDGSPDNCPAMCDAWAKKDSRIKVIHKTNGGLSDARNAGMAIATGELIGFIDSDDWIRPDMYQLLYEQMILDNSDIAACGVEMVWEDGTPNGRLTCNGCYLLNQEEAMLAIIQETYLKQPVWNKLYTTNLIKDILFPVGKCHEDVFWSYQAISAAQRVSVVDTPCYFYLQRSGSIMGNGYSLKRLDALDARALRNNFIRRNYPILATEDSINLIFACICHMQASLNHLKGTDKKTAIERIQKIVDNVHPARYGNHVTSKQRFWLYSAKISIIATCKLRNFLKIGL